MIHHNTISQFCLLYFRPHWSHNSTSHWHQRIWVQNLWQKIWPQSPLNHAYSGGAHKEDSGGLRQVQQDFYINSKISGTLQICPQNKFGQQTGQVSQFKHLQKNMSTNAKLYNWALPSWQMLKQPLLILIPHLMVLQNRFNRGA